MFLAAPRPSEIDLFEEFVETILVPGGCNLVVLRVCYGYQFASHPECATPDEPLSLAQARRIAGIFRKHGIRLIPKMNLLGHQAPRTGGPQAVDRTYGLLHGHPALDENPEAAVEYCPSLCPRHPEIKPIVFGLMDEIIDAFGADAIHIGMDEVFILGECERCKDTPKHILFAEWVNALAAHVKQSRGAQVLMWGDRLLDSAATGLCEWEASANGTHQAIELVNKDILICDWHYNGSQAYPSVGVFARAGFQILVCPLHRENGKKFLEYAAAHDEGHIAGLLQTSWEESGQIAGHMLRNPADYPGRRFDAERMKKMVETIEWIFGRTAAIEN